MWERLFNDTYQANNGAKCHMEPIKWVKEHPYARIDALKFADGLFRKMRKLITNPM